MLNRKPPCKPGWKLVGSHLLLLQYTLTSFSSQMEVKSALSFESSHEVKMFPNRATCLRLRPIWTDNCFRAWRPREFHSCAVSDVKSILSETPNWYDEKHMFPLYIKISDFAMIQYKQPPASHWHQKVSPFPAMVVIVAFCYFGL